MVIEVGDCLYNGCRALLRITGFEDAGAYKHALCAKLHHQGCVSRGSHTACREVYHRETSVVMHVLNQSVRNPENLCLLKQLFLAHGGDLGNLLIHHAHMAYGLHYIAGSRLAFGADHGSALVDAAKCLT